MCINFIWTWFRIDLRFGSSGIVDGSCIGDSEMLSLFLLVGILFFGDFFSEVGGTHHHGRFLKSSSRVIMMAVMRLSSSVITETGEVVTVVAENFEGFQPAFILSDAGTPKTDVYVRVTRDNPDGNEIGLIGWGAGTKALFFTMTSDGAPVRKLTPVIALMPNEASATSGPFSATVIESAVDPVLHYFETEKKIVLYYWINAWSPPPLDYPLSPPPPPSQSKSTLFEGVKPPPPSLVDDNYLVSPSYGGPQPDHRYTAVRDVPNWYPDGEAPESLIDLDTLNLVIPSMTKVSEKVGPIDLNRFWVAPFTDAHLFRFPAEYDPFPVPPVQDPYVPPYSPPPPGPPGPPPLVLPPPVITDPSASFIGNFPYLTYPFNKTTQTLTSVLYNVDQGFALRPSEVSTLDSYFFAMGRLVGLARCSRILMQTEGWLVTANKQEDPDQLLSAYRPVSTPIEADPDTYLVVNHPRPVLALPRGINKILLGRPKMTSFLGADFFITAALTYRYPAVATVSLCAGNPHVDFTIQCPSDHFDEYRRMGILPESKTPQSAPPIVGATIMIPGRYPASLVEAISTGSWW
jgi:hypothetical protein